jgi:hypothetical protein
MKIKIKYLILVITLGISAYAYSTQDYLTLMSFNTTVIILLFLVGKFGSETQEDLKPGNVQEEEVRRSSRSPVKKNKSTLKKNKRYYHLGDFVYKKSTDEKYSIFHKDDDGKITLKLEDSRQERWISELHEFNIESIKYENGRAQVSCPECSQVCRMPIFEISEVTCPKCSCKWVQRTDLPMGKTFS